MKATFILIIATVAFIKGVLDVIAQSRNPPRLSPAQRRAAREHYKRMGQ